MTLRDDVDLNGLFHLHPRRRRPAQAAGAGMLLLAAAALTFPAKTIQVVGGASGWLLWLAGALMLGMGLLTFSGTLRALAVAASLCAVGLGAYLTFNPTVGAFATGLVLAAALVIDGSFQLGAALHLRPLRAWRWLLASAATSLIAALLLAAGGPAHTPQAVAILLAAAFATTGVALIATGLARPAPRRPADSDTP
ncbi:DUF308 domain-containing protein [Phenylobacterium sp.]|uniref:DUF308 domain-containing protein n=1 Tax=Phenylobacterium sp. TaxID=1871053 RepID=UPI002ED80977